eukprot:6789664-Pyramimonas_sp.AAC.1
MALPVRSTAPTTGAQKIRRAGFPAEVAPGVDSSARRSCRTSRILKARPVRDMPERRDYARACQAREYYMRCFVRHSAGELIGG